MPVRSYHTVNGQIVGETQGGNLPLRTTYFHDALGSVIATTNQYGVAKKAIRYSDWGAINFQNSGWGAMRYGWVGGSGYRSLGPVHSDTYVRRRVVSTTEGRWSTRDRRWPWQRSYLYVYNSPTFLTDPTGNEVIPGGVPSKIIGLFPNLATKEGLAPVSPIIGAILGCMLDASFQGLYSSDSDASCEQYKSWCNGCVEAIFGGVGGTIGFVASSAFPAVGNFIGSVVGGLGGVLVGALASGSICESLIGPCGPQPYDPNPGTPPPCPSVPKDPLPGQPIHTPLHGTIFQ